MVGFLFFLVKGILWLILIIAVSKGWIKKERLSFFNKPPNSKKK